MTDEAISLALSTTVQEGCTSGWAPGWFICSVLRVPMPRPHQMYVTALEWGGIAQVCNMINEWARVHINWQFSFSCSLGAEGHQRNQKPGWGKEEMADQPRCSRPMGLPAKEGKMPIWIQGVNSAPAFCVRSFGQATIPAVMHSDRKVTPMTKAAAGWYKFPLPAHRPRQPSRRLWDKLLVSLQPPLPMNYPHRCVSVRLSRRDESLAFRGLPETTSSMWQVIKGVSHQWRAV